MRAGDSYKIRKMVDIGDTDEAIHAKFRLSYPTAEIDAFIAQFRAPKKKAAKKKPSA